MHRPSALVAFRTGTAVIATALAAILSGCAGTDSASAGDPAGAAVTARVVRVVDGDTLVLDIRGPDRAARETVRLIGIDTPESVHPERPVECFGPEASAFTAQLLPPATRVRLLRDREPRDDYGRLLAYVYRAADDLFVNLALVREGYATPLPIEPNTAFAAEFAAAATTAERALLGRWGACAG